MCLFYLDGHGHIDEGEIADLHFVLQIESACGGHVGISIVFGEITYGDAGIQNGCFVENRLCITDFQPTHKQRNMHHFFIARLLQACKTLKLKTPEFLVEAEVGFAYAEDILELRGAGVCTEINQIGNGGLLDADAIVFVVVFQVESQVSSSLKVVVPAEVVR